MLADDAGLGPLLLVGHGPLEGARRQAALGDLDVVVLHDRALGVLEGGDGIVVVADGVVLAGQGVGVEALGFEQDVRRFGADQDRLDQGPQLVAVGDALVAECLDRLVGVLEPAVLPVQFRLEFILLVDHGLVVAG